MINAVNLGLRSFHLKWSAGNIETYKCAQGSDLHGSGYKGTTAEGAGPSQRLAEPGTSQGPLREQA